MGTWDLAIICSDPLLPGDIIIAANGCGAPALCQALRLALTSFNLHIALGGGSTVSLTPLLKEELKLQRSKDRPGEWLGSGHESGSPLSGAPLFHPRTKWELQWGNHRRPGQVQLAGGGVLERVVYQQGLEDGQLSGGVQKGAMG